MKLFNRNLSFVQLQWITWIFITLLVFVFLLSVQSPLGSSVLAIENTAFYALMIYGNASFLIPRLYWKGKKTAYVLGSLLFMVIVSHLRVHVEYLCAKYLLKTESTPVIHLSTYLYFFFYDMILFIVGIIFRLSLDYFKVSRQQEELKKRTAEAELNLLKSQVQPHFLFNTLNNIYFVAQRESPATAELLERLSNIMRYFVDEGPKDLIQLSTETNFLKDYIELERLRMRHPLQIEFKVAGNTDALQIPPMMLIPLVENVFKHGINKRRDDNMINLNITRNGGYLDVNVRNRINSEANDIAPGGNGLKNLRARLQLLYQEKFVLETGQQGDFFKAFLKIPV